jgi:hypothetical protein
MSMGIRTPGLQLLYALPVGQTTALFMGTCIAAPEPEGEKFKIPVMNDLSGRSVPYQLVQDGELWTIYATMNVFDYSLIQSLRALENGSPSSFSINGNPGSGNFTVNPGVGGENGIARGTLHIGISDWKLIIVNTYFNTASSGRFAGPPDLIPARMFFSCNIRKYKEDTQGTRVLEIAMAIDTQNLFNPAVSIINRGFALFSENPGVFPPLAPFIGVQ